MKPPEYFISVSTPWNTWDSTELSHGDFHFVCTADACASYRSQYSVEKGHPGFTSVYRSVSAEGGDIFLVTSVLKYCLLHAADETLDAFYDRTEMLKMVRLAISIGLSGNDLVAHLYGARDYRIERQLPDDIMGVST